MNDESITEADISTKTTSMGFASIYNGEDDCVSLKNPPIMPAENLEKKQTIAGVGSCTTCHGYFPSHQLKNCSRCKAGGPYCSIECQKTAWKKHKKICSPPTTTDTTEKTRADPTNRAATMILKRLYAYADTKLFGIHSTHCAFFGIPVTRVLFDISTLARMKFKQDGPGVLILHFQDCHKMEHTIGELHSHICGDIPSNRGFVILLPYASFIRWPIRESSVTISNKTMIKKLKALGIDSIMENLTQSQYALGVCAGESEALHVSSFEQNTTGLAKIDIIKADISRDLKKRIETDIAFSKCRGVMAKIKVEPGIFWLKNIVTNDHGKHWKYFERKELRKVTPDLLLRTLVQYRLGVETKGKDIHAVQFIVENGSGCSLNYMNENNNTWWPDLLKRWLPKILDPHTFVGFFNYGEISNSENVYVRVFEFKIP